MLKLDYFMEASVVDNLSPSGFQVLNFVAMAAAMLIAVVAAWLFSLYYKKKRKRKRKHQGHGRINPTLAELGGLPPPRKPAEPNDRPGRGTTFDP